MIKINYKKDNTYGNTMYEFLNQDLIMKWFTDRSGDLYWVLFDKAISHNDEYDFRVPIQNYKFYSIIERIYNDFKNGKIFYQTEIDADLKYNAATLNRNQYVREAVHDIFNSNTEEVTWDSDEDIRNKTNSLKIIKEHDAFILRFTDVIHGNLIRVCFKKNRGHYGPCSMPFFRAYEHMDKIKDAYDISFEEYFNKVKPTLDNPVPDTKTYLKKSEN